MSRKRFNKFGKFGEQERKNKTMPSDFKPYLSEGQKKQDGDNKLKAAKKLQEIELYATKISDNDSLWIGRMKEAVLGNKVLTEKQIKLVAELHNKLVPIESKVQEILKPHQDQLKKIEGDLKSNPKKASSKGKFYVVWEGRTPGIYTSWSDVLKEVENYPNAKYRKFKTRQEAEEAFSKQPQDYYENKPEKQVVLHQDTKVEADVHIYCDGACEPNPGECGVGMVVYMNNEIHSLFYGLYLPTSTNNVAELNGLFYALKKAEVFSKEGKTVQILCDSMYAINSITTWAYSWKSKGWKIKKNKEVKNLDIIKEAHALYDSLKDLIKVSHIKGHNGFEGNELADRMSLRSIALKEAGFSLYQSPIDIVEILKKD